MDDEKIIEGIKAALADYKIDKRELDLSYYCEELNMNEKEFAFSMVELYSIYLRQFYEYKISYNKLEREHRDLEESYLKMLKSRLELQQVKVKNGLPIAKKGPELFWLDYLYKTGHTDKEIMEQYGISRATMWRKKKELERRKAAGEKL